MQNMTKEKFMECLSTWPLDIQEQVPLDDHSITCFVNPKNHPPVDWNNMSWEKEEIDFNSEWMVKHLSSYSVSVINLMIIAFIEYKNLVGKDDIERHNRMEKYLAANGTWPKPPVFASTEEKTLIVVDGCHRMCQMIIARNMMDKMFILQNKGFVRLQEKHEVWIGKTEITKGETHV